MPWLHAAEIHISVGRNIGIGRGETREAEPYIAADPKDANNLIISVSETVDQLKSESFVAQSYFTNDGGMTWAPSPLPGLREGVLNGSIRAVLDTWITFAPNGNAYYTCIPITSEGRYPIYVFRSTDNGHLWTGPTKISGAKFDQPRTVASLDSGKAEVYIAASTREPVLVGSDGGDSFKTIAKLQPAKPGHEQAMNPLVLVDGSLLLPYVGPGQRKIQELSCTRIFLSRTLHGGVMIGPSRFIADISRPDMANAYFATDLSHGRFRGCVYAAWENGDFGFIVKRQRGQIIRGATGTRRDLAFAYSTDDGKTWSKATILRANGQGPVDFPTMAVSQDGILGVLWVQYQRYDADPHSYNIWFAASADGGKRLSPPVRVSSETSRPDAKLNPRWYFTYRPSGGDYIGLAADADDSFHAVWIDARDGAFRLYTARIQVQR
jgi:hypothetical protein